MEGPSYPPASDPRHQIVFPPFFSFSCNRARIYSRVPLLVVQFNFHPPPPSFAAAWPRGFGWHLTLTPSPSASGHRPRPALWRAEWTRPAGCESIAASRRPVTSAGVIHTPSRWRHVRMEWISQTNAVAFQASFQAHPPSNWRCSQPRPWMRQERRFFPSPLFEPCTRLTVFNFAERTTSPLPTRQQPPSALPHCLHRLN